MADFRVDLIAVDIDELDITKHDDTFDFIVNLKPDLVINSAAYTAVDGAEEDRELAFQVNGKAPAFIAEACDHIDARLIHISTDFVFDGEKNSPYSVVDAPNPVGVYGESKLQGELAIRRLMPTRSTIVRTSWLYSSSGSNFVKTMIRLMSEKDSLGVVVDQVGTPTCAKGLAEIVWQFGARDDLSGTFHWTDGGVASWYDFAVAIQEEAIWLGLLEKAIPIKPIKTNEYPTPAKRPPCSVLDKSATYEALNIDQHDHWRVALRQMLNELK